MAESGSLASLDESSVSRWNCRSCTLINDGQSLACEACEIPRPKDEPVVVDLMSRESSTPLPPSPSSTNVPGLFRAAKNYISDQIIPGIMNTLSPPASPDTVIQETGSSDRIPSSPSKDKSIRVELVATQEASAQWACKRCTFANEPSATFCGICQSPKVTFIPTDIPDHLMVSPSDSPQPVFFPPSPQSNGAHQDVSVSAAEGACGGTGLSPEPKVYASSSSSPVSTPEGTDEQVIDLSDDDGTPTSPNLFKAGQTKIQEHRTAMRRKGWSCQQCTLDNPEDSKECKVCGHRKSLQNALNGDSFFEPKDNEWACPACTYINLKEMSVCCMCEMEQPLANRPVAVWSCSECKNINPDSALKCEECDNVPFDGDATIQRRGLQRQKSVMTETKRKQDVSVAIEEFKRIRNSCRELKTDFIDDAFPPENRSLFFSPDAPRPQKFEFQWLRPSAVQLKAWDYSPLPWVLFRNPMPSDISQGLLGNCWFLSALSVIAENEQLLQRILITLEINNEGAYQIRLCHDGMWETVLIDDLLPCQDQGYLVYSKAKRKQLWVPLIEKALAKMSGCYEALTAGRCIEGLATLTGAPCESLQMHPTGKTGKPVDPDLVWAQLLSAKEAGYLMGASCGSGNMKIDPQHYHDMGLRPRHSYSVLDIQDLCDNRLIQLRNPWGHFSWSGDWSDGSPLWTDDMKEALMAHGAEEGIFWMSLADIMKYFDCVDICKLRPEWAENRLRGTFPSSADVPMQVMILKVTEATEIDFTLYQTWRRLERASRNPLDLTLVVLRAHGMTTRGMTRVMTYSKRQLRAFVGCSAFLDTGVYVIVSMAFNHWQVGQPHSGPSRASPASNHNYTVAVHSAKPVEVNRISASTECLADTIIQLAIQKGKKHEGRQGVTCYYLDHGWAGIIIVIENLRTDANLHIKCDCNGSFNVTSTRGDLITVDCVPAMHRQVLTVLTQVVDSSYTICHHITHRLSPNKNLQPWAPAGLVNSPPLTKDILGLHAPRPI